MPNDPEYKRQWYLLNKYRILAKRKKWYEANKGRSLQQSREWAVNNPERRRAIVRKSAQLHPRGPRQHTGPSQERPSTEESRGKARAYMKEWSRRNTDKTRKWAKRYRLANLETTRQRSRDYAKKHMEKIRPRLRKWKQSNPEKVTANRRVRYAIESGRIIRPSECESCHASRKVDAHHHKGYSPEFWYDVKWLCRICHRAEHARN